MAAPEAHADRAHAEYPPSSAYRWLRCHGSVGAAQGIPQRTSTYAEEGTECHEAASAILEGAPYDQTVRDLSPDQLRIVEEYTEFCFDLIDRMSAHGTRPTIYIEKRMAAAGISSKFFGTGDFLILAGGVLRIVDLKAGAWPVQVRDSRGRINPQLACYVLLALATLGAPVSPWAFDPAKIGVHQIRLTIVQPRVYDLPQTTVVEVEELREFLDEVIEAIDMIEAGSNARVPGQWCGFCPAKGACPELRRAAVDRAKLDFGDNIPFDEWAAVLAEAETIAAHVNGIRERIRRAVEKGKTVPGFKLVHKRALKQWHDFDKTATVLAVAGMPRSDLYRETPASPAAVLKAFKRLGWDPDILKSDYKTVPSGVTVVPEDDPRPAITYQPGADFADTEDE